MSPDQNPYSYENRDRLTFESIGASLWKVLMRTHQAQLAGSQLATSFFAYQASPQSSRRSAAGLSEILAGYNEIEEEAANMFLLDMRRQCLLSAIGAFDSFLSDTLRFLFLFRPSMIPPKARPKKPAPSAVDNVEQIVRYGDLAKWKKRLEFLASEFGMALDPVLVDELETLIRLRNEIAHHSGLYMFTLDEKSGQVWAEAKVVPEVSFEEAQSALMIVTEISDAVLVAICRRLFGEDPRVRTLIPEVEAVHKQLRAKWAEKRSMPPDIEEISSPRWALKELPDGSMSWVGDLNDDFLIRPTGIEVVPLILTMSRHTRHGAKAYVKIDDNPRIELGMLHPQDFVDQLLTGQCLLVEFHEEPWPGPRYARYSLIGFAAAWEEACRKKFGELGGGSTG